LTACTARRSPELFPTRESLHYDELSRGIAVRPGHNFMEHPLDINSAQSGAAGNLHENQCQVEEQQKGRGMVSSEDTPHDWGGRVLVSAKSRWMPSPMLMRRSTTPRHTSISLLSAPQAPRRGYDDTSGMSSTQAGGAMNSLGALQSSAGPNPTAHFLTAGQPPSNCTSHASVAKHPATSTACQTYRPLVSAHVLLIAFMVTGCAANLADAQTQVAPSSLDALLNATGEYVVQLRENLSNMVAEERYEQSAENPRRGGQRRQLRSDFLLVRPEGFDWFLEYRDVIEIDGRVVQDRQDRLTNLFVSPSRSAHTQAQAITVASARHNIGGITRTLNTPTLALVLLHPSYQPQLRFTRTFDTEPTLDAHRSEYQYDDTDLWVIAFIETASDTLIHGAGGKPLPVEGRFWIEAETSTVIASELLVIDPDLRGQVNVWYQMNPELGVAVPTEMREEYRDLNGWHVEGSATYTNFRRFRVLTDESSPDTPDRD